MLAVEEIVPYLVGLIVLVVAKLALFHLSVRLGRWWKERSRTRPKCHNIFEYNFLDEYESAGEESPATDNNDPTSNSGGSKRLRSATEKLLAAIRQRRQNTAAALLKNASQTHVANSENESGIHAKDLVQNSDYYKFLEEVNREEHLKYD